MNRTNTPEFKIRSSVDSLLMKLRGELYGNAGSNTKLDTGLMEKSVPWQWAKLDREQTTLAFHTDEKGNTHNLAFTQPQEIWISDNTKPFAFRVSHQDVTAVKLVTSGNSITGIPLALVKGITSNFVNNTMVGLDFGVENPDVTLSRIESVVTDSGAINSKLVLKNVQSGSLIEQMSLEDHTLHVKNANIEDINVTGNVVVAQTLTSESVTSSEITLSQGDAFAGKLVICDDASGKLRFGVPEELNFEGALENVAFLNTAQTFLAENEFNSPQPGGSTLPATPITLAWTGTSAFSYPGMQILFKGDYNAQPGEEFYRTAGIIQVKWEDSFFRTSSILFKVANDEDPGTDYMENALKIHHNGVIPVVDFYGNIYLSNNRLLDTPRLKIRNGSAANRVLFSTADGTAEWKDLDHNAIPAIVRTDKNNTFVNNQTTMTSNSSSNEALVVESSASRSPAIMKNIRNTNTEERTLILERSGGTPTSGYGGSLQFNLENSGGSSVEAGSIDFNWENTETTKPKIDFTIENNTALTINSDRELIYPKGATEGFVLIAGDNAGTMEWASISSVITTSLEGNIAFLDVAGGLGSNDQVFTASQWIKIIFDPSAQKAHDPLTLIIEDKQWNAVTEQWEDNQLTMPQVNNALTIRRHKGINGIEDLPSSSGIDVGWGTGIKFNMTAPENSDSNIKDGNYDVGHIDVVWGDQDGGNFNQDSDAEMILRVMENSRRVGTNGGDSLVNMVDALKLRHNKIGIPNAGVPGSGFVLTSLDAQGNAVWKPPTGSTEEGDFVEFVITGTRDDNTLICYLEYESMDNWDNEYQYAMYYTELDPRLDTADQSNHIGSNGYGIAGFNPFSVRQVTSEGLIYAEYLRHDKEVVPLGTLQTKYVGNTDFQEITGLFGSNEQFFVLRAGHSYDVEGVILAYHSEFVDDEQIYLQMMVGYSFETTAQGGDFDQFQIRDIGMSQNYAGRHFQLAHFPFKYHITVDEGQQDMYISFKLSIAQQLYPGYTGGEYEGWLDYGRDGVTVVWKSLFENAFDEDYYHSKQDPAAHSYIKITRKQEITEFEASALFRPYKRTLGWYVEKTDTATPAFGPVYYVDEVSKLHKIVVNCKTPPTNADGLRLKIEYSYNYTLWSSTTGGNEIVVPMGESYVVVDTFAVLHLEESSWVKLNLIDGGGSADATVQLLFTNP